MDIAGMIRRAASSFKDAPALRTANQTLSFAEFDEQTERLGNGLLSLGLAPGDRVGILLPNGIEVVLAYYALAKVGLVRVPLNIKDPADDHRYKLEDSGAKVLLTSVPGFEDILPVINIEKMRQLLITGSPEPTDHLWQSGELYRIGYTGGTTGRPKGVLLTHGIEMALVRNYLVDLLPEIKVGDRMLHAAPMTHATGSFFMPHLIRGACNYIMEQFEANELMRLIREVDPSCMFLVPTMISMLVDHPSAEPGMAPSLRRLGYGASPISPTVAAKATRIFGSVLAQTYGQSEAPMTITWLGPEEHHRVGSAGKPYTFVSVQVHDEHGNQVPDGQEGEVVARGDIVTPGYHNRPEATADTLRGGWLHTGDIGRFDEDGFLYLLDRKNDLIISGGYNVFPREVEDALMAHESIVEVAVCGIADERWGQVVHAAVVTGPNVEVSDEELRVHCEKMLSTYKLPRQFSRWDQLPKSAAGKILRREVAAKLTGRETVQ